MLSSIRRRERRLSEKGALRFEVERPTADTAQEAFAHAARVEMQGWKAGTKFAMEKDPEQMAFFREYAPRAARAGRLHLSFLSLDGTPIAMSFGEVFDGTYYAYKTGFDDRFRAQAPGILLQYKLIGALAADGVTRLDFQGQMDGFKSTWTDKAIKARQLRIYPLIHRGLFGFASDVTLALLRGIARVLGRFRSAPPKT